MAILLLSLFIISCTSSDKTNPLLEWLSPNNEEVVSGEVILKVKATDNKEVTKVEFFSGSNLLGEGNAVTGEADNYSLSWDSTTVNNGSVTLKAKVTDKSDNTQEVERKVTVDNLPLQGDKSVEFSSKAKAFTVQILHAADQEGGLDAINDAPRFSAVVNGLKDDFENTLILASGDLYIPGAFFNASGGEADIKILNGIGTQAAAMGNHEFDLGLNVIRGLLSDTQFPYLTSNVDFTGTSLEDSVQDPGQEASTIPNSISKSTVITVNGEKFGIVGATTPLLPNISSPGDAKVSPTDPNDLDALAAIIQTEVDALTATGINKIILLAHLQDINNEIGLAGRLKNVDIIIAGGSDTLLAKASDHIRDEFGKSRRGTYPLLFNSTPTTNSLTTLDTNEPIALVNTDREYRYVGRLIADFDEDGILTGIDPLSGAYATDEQGVTDTGNAAPAQEVVDAVNEVKAVIEEKDGTVFGATDVYLNGARESVRTEETNLGNLTADANLAAAKKSDASTLVSIKNGGGIRAAIGAVEPGPDGKKIPPVGNEFGKQDGDVSQLDIENALRFNNGLTLLTVKAAELRNILEHGVAAWTETATPGQFPQVGGVKFSFDPSGQAIEFNQDNGELMTPGERIRSMVIVNEAGNIIDVIVKDGELQGNPDRQIRIVTLGFLATLRDNNLGGDSYPFPDRERVDLKDGEDDFGEQKALADYLAENFPRETPYSEADEPIEQDERIQNLSKRNDDVIPEGFVLTTLVHNIQGENDESSLKGQSVTVEGIVVGAFPGLEGFFVQEEDADADANPKTSEGIFVFQDAAPTVAIGDKVQVTGAVDEFFGLTQLDNDNDDLAVEIMSSGQSLPTAASLNFPLESAEDFEAYEGMLVNFSQDLVVTDQFNLGRFGEVVLSTERLYQFTETNAPSVAGFAAHNDLKVRSQILLDDGSTMSWLEQVPYLSSTNPEFLRLGDKISNLTGVLGYGFSAYRLHPTNGLSFTPVNTRPNLSVDGDIKVASFNVLNYFTTIDDGTVTDNGPRGADSAAEFKRQEDKIIDALLDIDADIVGLMELENNGTAIDTLTTALNNKAGANTYAFIDTGVTGTGGTEPADIITVGIIYKPASVKPIGNTAVLETGSFDGSSRPSVIQAFEDINGQGDDGGHLVVSVNHFKSKGCGFDDPTGLDEDQLDGQACFNAARLKSSQELLAFLTTDPTNTGEENVLIIGDLNAYTQEDPIKELVDNGFNNLLANLDFKERYTFIFFGEAGSLDYALASDSLNSQVTDAVIWHINADEPRTLDYNDATEDAGEGSNNIPLNKDTSLYVADQYRSSDHDPIIVGLNLQPSAPVKVELEYLGQFAFSSGSEIAAFDKMSNRLFVTAGDTLEILDITNPLGPKFVSTVDVSSLNANAGGANSVAVKNGVVAVAVENTDKQANGFVVFLDKDGNKLGEATVGALPDMLTFTPDGNKVLVANEGEPNDDYDNDPEGSVSIIDVSNGVNNANVMTADFNGFDTNNLDPEVRIFGFGASIAQDLEPEYIAVAPDGTKAFVALQENNALGILDIVNATFTDIVPFGFKDHSAQGNFLDPSNEDNGINIAGWPVRGMYQPDGIDAFAINGSTYVITANEGDARDYDGFSEEERVKDLTLDAQAFPNAASLQEDANLGRLKTTTANGDGDADGDFEEIYSYGARSFSIWDDSGTLVFDSGDAFEQITAQQIPQRFNGDFDEDDNAYGLDNRSDDKGPEPEGVVVADILGQYFAFIGLERVGGIMIYDVTKPSEPKFLDYEFDNGTERISPEGLLFIPAQDSPNGQHLFVVAHEVSKTTTIYRAKVHK